MNSSYGFFCLICGAFPYFELMNAPIGKMNIICKCGQKTNVTIKEYIRLASREKQKK